MSEQEKPVEKVKKPKTSVKQPKPVKLKDPVKHYLGKCVKTGEDLYKEVERDSIWTNPKK